MSCLRALPIEEGRGGLGVGSGGRAELGVWRGRVGELGVRVVLH